ncbi:MAG TPA: TonB-dependent receptor, partial [Rudaea sp.]|nr:TonB-dependent receptor [Rudaea sp.]
MKLLAATVLVALAGMRSGVGQTTTDENSPPPKDSQRLQTVTVTGSLIPQAEIETASPVITITAQQIERQGFASVYDALRAQPVATGSVLDNQAVGGFTAGAKALSLLGLDPAFTLYLINGHPMADYPLLYNGVSNFVDLTNIPTGMLDHIDILPGNQSSIYGSSAIAGVINIVLKDHIDGYEVTARAGGYSGGGGSDQRLQFTGGQTWGALDLTFGLQYDDQKPIWGYDRKLTASTNSNPDPNERYGTRNFLWLYFDSSGGGHYVDPGQDTCNALHSLNHNTTNYDYRPGEGNFCGSRYNYGFSTLLDKNRAGTGYLNLKYALNEDTQLYGDLLYTVSHVTFSQGPLLWESSLNTGALFYDADTGRLESVQHIFSPEEIGSQEMNADDNITRSYTVWGGIKGSVGSQWEYDLYYSRSQTNLDDKLHWPINSAIENFFTSRILGPQLGTTVGFPVYHAPNLANLYKALTPQEYASFIGIDQTQSNAWTQNINLQFNNTEVFSLPAGAVGMAGLIQVGNQAWNNPVDPNVAAGNFYGLTATAGSGTRNNYAAATEIRVPILSTLTADASVRYDHYGNQNVGGGDSKATYKLGLEYRPVESLLMRGNYATAFRAPDMAYTFGGQSGFYDAQQTDYYVCAKYYPNLALSNCPDFQSQSIFTIHQGNPALKSVTAKSYGFGTVWSPSSNFNASADYYNIRIANEVELQNLDQILRTDSQCLLGNLDPTTPTCQAALAEVVRGPVTGNPANSEAILNLNVLPINIANEHVSGIVSSLK